MPCLLTNSWKPGISVSETPSCYHNGMCYNCWYERGNFGPSTFFLMFITLLQRFITSKQKESLNKPGLISYCYVTRIVSNFLFSFSSVLLQCVIICYLNWFKVFHYSSWLKSENCFIIQIFLIDRMHRFSVDFHFHLLPISSF